MPNYHNSPADMVAWFVKQDRPSEESVAKLPHDEAEIRALAAGRKLAGTKGLSCAQCHTFGNVAATGIQAIDMQLMTKRVRSEWFFRYLLDPIKYRPGTRMPIVFLMVKVFTNRSTRGMQSIRSHRYGCICLRGMMPPCRWSATRSDCSRTYGSSHHLQKLLEGLSARGIAVGYPGGINIAWDAESMALKSIWQGAFIDASMHWRDRGVGRQKPLGDLVFEFENSPAVSFLSSPKNKWPDQSDVREKYRFLGYRLAKDGSPTFRYQIGQLVVSDSFAVDSSDSQKGFKRSITIEQNLDESKPRDSTDGSLVAVLRLARGSEIADAQAGQWLVNKQLKIQLLSLIQKTFGCKVTLRMTWIYA